MNFNYDLDKVKAQVQEVMEHASDTDEICTNDLYNSWLTNKRRLIDMLGGLIWQSEELIEIKKSESELVTSYEEFMNEINFCFRLLENDKKGFYEFLIAQGKEGFYDNKVVKEWTYKNKKIPKGMKLNKAFKFFIEDKNMLNKWQSKHSMTIQRKSFSGYLRISVHPLDYLSSATSAHGWSSCHDLRDGHCAGPLSYMGDSTTLVAYICNPDKTYKLSTFPSGLEWNSKKWRVMLYINEDNTLIVGGKGYPFEADEVVNIAIKELQKLTRNTFGDIFKPKSRKEIKEYIEDYDKNAIHYNDCLLASSFYGFVSKAADNPVKVIAGSAPVCLYCGENEIQQPNGFGCKECGEYGECEICGAPIGVYDDDQYEIEGQYICEECYDEHAVWCNECGDIFNKDSDNIIFDDGDEEFYCCNCYEELLNDRCIQDDDDDWFDL